MQLSFDRTGAEGLTETFLASDGWPLALHIFRPVRDRGLPPVVLLPGHAVNRYTFGLTRPGNLVDHLLGRGRVVHVVEYRGTGMSRQGDRPVRVEDKALLDLPEAVEHILGRTRASQVDVVAHSMGGSFLYAYLAQRPGTVRRAVALCSPDRYSVEGKRGSLDARGLAPYLMPLLARSPSLPVGFMSRLAARIGFTSPATPYFCPENADGALKLWYLALATEDVPAQEVRSLIRWVVEGTLPLLPGGGDVRPLMGRIEVPMRILAASRDQMVPLETLQSAYEALGSREKELRVMGARSGAATEYGHVDILLGERAPREVFPLISGWLEEG